MILEQDVIGGIFHSSHLSARELLASPQCPLSLAAEEGPGQGLFPLFPYPLWTSRVVAPDIAPLSLPSGLGDAQHQMACLPQMPPSPCRLMEGAALQWWGCPSIPAAEGRKLSWGESYAGLTCLQGRQGEHLEAKQVEKEQLAQSPSMVGVGHGCTGGPHAPLSFWCHSRVQQQDAHMPAELQPRASQASPAARHSPLHQDTQARL